jgi:hypothetical protein
LWMYSCQFDIIAITAVGYIGRPVLATTNPRVLELRGFMHTRNPSLLDRRRLP